VRAIEPAAQVVYVGTPRGIETRAIARPGDELFLLDVAPLRGAGVKGFVKGVARATATLPEARALVQRLRPNVALSLGGYAGGPVALAARLDGVPVTLLEPNSTLGLSNRLLTPVAERSYTAFPETERYLRPSTIRRFGVPLRRAFTPAAYAPKDGPVHVLVLGGSQGAKGINAVMPRAVALAVARGADLRVTHQTGRDRDVDVRAGYAAEGLSARVSVVPFIDDVSAALAATDLVVARSGASSCMELCAVGRAGILIPYPFAADDHQLKNARSIEAGGGAVAIAESDATPERLATEVLALAGDPARRRAMADAARALGKPDAARAVAVDLLAIARAHAARARRSQEPSRTRLCPWEAR
jgi:UDP-N-acetylglucosamine--N-acetylmuramyl-(pentapeptide) pyrophosphoryl-undecaprenol N-acetylglucosamine transferase